MHPSDLTGWELLEHVADAVVVADGEDRVVWLNPAAEELIGRSASRSAGRPLHELLGKGPASELPLLARRAGAPVAVAELTVGGAPCEAIAGVLGRGRAVVLTLRDRRGQAGARAEVRQAERISSLATLAAGIAHEVKNPLGGIRGAAQLAARGVSDPKAREYLDVIVKEVDRIAGLIDRLRELAADRQPEERTPVDLNRLLHELALLQGTTGEASLALDLDPSLPRVSGDPAALRQLFLNLVRNGLEAARTRVTVTTRVETGRKRRNPGGTLAPLVDVTVADDGPGVPPAQRARIFEPFFTTKAHGSGLGLATVAKIAHDHQGTVELLDNPAGGARFVVTLPALKA